MASRTGSTCSVNARLRYVSYRVGPRIDKALEQKNELREVSKLNELMTYCLLLLICLLLSKRLFQCL